MTRLALTALAALALSSSATAIPAAQFSPDSSSEPCGQVATLVAEAISSDGAATSVPVDVALACLKSVPNKPDQAGELIDSIKAFVSWQSTLAWLKNPPKSYDFPAVDIMSKLDTIKKDAQDGKYDSEYDFQADIYMLLRSAHDGHLAFSGDALGRFIFYNDLVGDIVSVSLDGSSLPKLYHYSDITDAASSGNDPVAISKINDKDAVQYYIDAGKSLSANQDPDSQYNGQFPIYAATSRGPLFGQSLVHLHDKITIEYEDGTSRESDTVGAFAASADPGTEWDGITSGDDFYDRFCTPSTSSSSTSKKMMKRDEEPAILAPNPLRSRQTTDAFPNYPSDPIVTDDGYGIISGYFLSGKGYEDAAVLAITSFLAEGASDTVAFIADFQSTVENFLAECKKAGKSKLVIDLTSNGGGAIVAATDLFVQLFPDKDRFSANNMRRSDSLVAMTKVMQNTIEKSGWQPRTDNENQAASTLATGTLGSSLNPFTGIYAPEGDQYASIEELVAEVNLAGDKFTAYQRSLFNIPSAEYNVTGVGSRADPPAAVFSPDDVVVLTDGTCGSSCTILSYFLIYDVGVKFVTVGGRPQTGKIQSLGGVEGSETYTWDTMALAATAAVVLDESQSNGDLGTIAQAYAYSRASSPPQVNAKNAFAPFDASTPLQFLKQYANCKFWYTADMILDPTMVWERAVDATWTDPDSVCVKDSQTSVGGVLNTNNDNLDDAFADSASNTGGDDEDAAGVMGVSVMAVIVALATFLITI